MVLPQAAGVSWDLDGRCDGLLVGDDWAEDHHDIEVMDAAGQVLARARLPEGVAGMARLHELIGLHLGEDAEGAQVVIGIETDRGPWVAALVAAGYTVFPVNPRQASRYREPPGFRAETIAAVPARWDHRTVPGLSGSKAIEDAAIKWAMGLERAAGRRPRDTRYLGAPADIESPPRLIEVKSFGTSNRGYDLWLEVRQLQEAKTNPEFYVYVVENVGQGDPGQFTLRVLGGDRLRRLLERAKEQRYYTVPWPVADYDSCPSLDG
jgi:Transposase/Domain of unknown function (DUF3883)